MSANRENSGRIDQLSDIYYPGQEIQPFPPRANDIWQAADTTTQMPTKPAPRSILLTGDRASYIVWMDIDAVSLNTAGAVRTLDLSQLSATDREYLMSIAEDPETELYKINRATLGHKHPIDYFTFLAAVFPANGFDSIAPAESLLVHTITGKALVSAARRREVAGVSAYVYDLFLPAATAAMYGRSSPIVSTSAIHTYGRPYEILPREIRDVNKIICQFIS